MTTRTQRAIESMAQATSTLRVMEAVTAAISLTALLTAICRVVVS